MVPQQSQQQQPQQSQQQQQPEGTRPPPKRRNRKAVSCVSCREKKIKCDRVVPCNQCIKRGEQDQCRIEQKPKIVHDHAASREAYPQQNSSFYTQSNQLDPLSPGSAAYSQFSAAISTAKDQVNAAQASGSPPPAEVEAIKARLAQVEALLAGQMPLSVANALAPSSPAASANWNAYRSTSGVADLDLNRVNSHSPASHFSGHRSASYNSSGHHSSVSPHDAPEDTDESDQDDDTAPSSPRAEPQRISPTNRLRTDIMPISRKELDSDTEDAATVLERLAMDGPSRDGTTAHKAAPKSRQLQLVHQQPTERMNLVQGRSLNAVCRKRRKPPNLVVLHQVRVLKDASREIRRSVSCQSTRLPRSGFSVWSDSLSGQRPLPSFIGPARSYRHAPSTSLFRSRP